MSLVNALLLAEIPNCVALDKFFAYISDTHCLDLLEFHIDDI